MEHRRPSPLWQPRKLLLQAAREPLSVFVAALRCPFLLLVALGDAESELAGGLRTADAVQRVTPDGLTSGLTTRLSVGSALPGSMGAELTHRSVPTGLPDRIPASLMRQPHYVVPIKKRDSSSFLQHVSVGRARNHDIVLRHPSISKFHSWFELQDDGGLVVKDCDSSNHTFLDGERVNGRVEVQPGQALTFGSVECRVCTPDSLWTALNS